jgi:hypothetical protein
LYEESIKTNCVEFCVSKTPGYHRGSDDSHCLFNGSVRRRLRGPGGSGGGGSGGSGGSGGKGGTFTITGIPPEYNGKYAFCNVYIDGIDEDIEGGEGMLTRALISNGRVSCSLTKWSRIAPEAYRGNDTAQEVLVSLDTLRSDFDGSDGSMGFITFENVKFSNGSATRSWNDADLSGLY